MDSRTSDRDIDLEEFRRSIRTFCAREIGRDLERRIDADDAIPAPLMRTLVELGYTGIAVPEEYGGGGAGVHELVVLAEELNRASSGVAGTVITTAVSGGTNILESGTPTQRAEMLPGICDGSLAVAMGITEPDAGSDVAGIRTRAVREDGGWRLTGTKMFTTGALIADVLMIMARSDPGAERHRGLGLFLVPNPSEGLALHKLRKIGNRGCGSCEVVLDGVLLPPEAVLGGEEAAGSGWDQLMKTFEVERLLLGAMAVGTAQRALDEAVTYAGQRHQFGQAIGNFQAVAHLLADMATSVAASRAFVFSVADRLAAGKPCAQEAAMVKLFTTEQTKQVCLTGMQVLGGYGYLAEFDMERLLRDSLLGPVGGGTSQIQRSIIAKGLGFKA